MKCRLAVSGNMLTAYLDGEIEGVNGVSLGVPAVLTKKGVAMIVPIHMNEYEKERFNEAAEVVRETTKFVKSSLDED